MNTNNVVLKYQSNLTQAIPILNLKSSEIFHWTHRIILTVRHDGSDYYLENSTIEARRQLGRPKRIKTKRGAPAKLYIHTHNHSETDAINQLNLNFDSITASDPNATKGKEQPNGYSLESLLEAANAERIHLEQSNQEDLLETNALEHSIEYRTEANDMENLDDFSQQEKIDR